MLSAIDHIGISVPNVDAKMQELEAAGAKVTMRARTVAGLPKAGFVQDPFGITIEVLQDPEAVGFFEADGAGVSFQGRCALALDVAELVRASARGAGEHQEVEA